ncbi:MAG: NAD(P)/FAD-dependent oxidoreductase [Streptosporangiales bacterium]
MTWRLSCAPDDGTADMGLRLDGWLWTASSRTQEGAWAPALSLIERAGATSPFEPIDADEIARTTGSTASYAGVVEPFAETVQPAKLAIGLRDLAIERGVAVHEGTPATAIDLGPTCRLETPRGRIEADQVVLAANAWLSSVPEIRRHMYVVDSQVIATQPVPGRLDAIGWTSGQSICDSQTQVLYYQRTRDGRVVLGRGSGGPVFGDRLGEKTNRHPRWVRDSVRELYRVYPALRGVRHRPRLAGPDRLRAVARARLRPAARPGQRRVRRRLERHRHRTDPGRQPHPGEPRTR